MSIIKDFTFNGRTASSFGVQLADNTEWWATPERDMEHISVPGRSGDLLIDNGRFNNMEINFEVNRVTDGWALSELINWLALNPGYQRLSVSDDPDHYRLASFEGMTVPVFTQLKKGARITIPFNCQPQRFLVADENGITKSYGQAAYTFTNYGDDANPVIRINKGNSYSQYDYVKIMDTAYPSDALYILLGDADTQAVFDTWEYAIIDTSAMSTYIHLTTGENVPGGGKVGTSGWVDYITSDGWADHFGDQAPFVTFKHGHTYSFQYGGGTWDEGGGNATLFVRRWEL